MQYLLVHVIFEFLELIWVSNLIKSFKLFCHVKGFFSNIYLHACQVVFGRRVIIAILDSFLLLLLLLF